MKREILFRGKRNDGMWVYGDLLHIERDFKKVLQIVDWSEKPYGHDVIPDTVGQFIGIKDKNGKDIYEGDVVSVKMSKHDRIGRFFVKTQLPPFLNAQVKYNSRQCKFELIFAENKEGLISCEIGWGREEFEIVDNIHDNPELIK